MKIVWFVNKNTKTIKKRETITIAQQPKGKEPPRTGLFELEKEQKELAIEKTRKEIELKDLDIAKKMGESIPTDIVRLLFHQHYKNIIVTFKEEMVKAMTIQVRALGGKKREVIDVELQIETSITEAIKKTNKVTKNDLDNLVAENSIKRSRGERDRS